MLSETACACCGKFGIHHREVTRSHRVGGSLLLIERIPQEACLHCEEFYFTAQTMHKVARIKQLRESLAIEMKVPVAAFLAAA